MDFALRASPSSLRTPRVDLITADVSARAALAGALESEGLGVVEHFAGVEADLAGPRDGDTDCIVIVHDPKRLDALVLIARLRALDLRAPILILTSHDSEAFWRMARQHDAEVMIGGRDLPGAVAVVVRNIVDLHQRVRRSAPD